jgi:fibronectin-binding autotransporter adhesin
MDGTLKMGAAGQIPSGATAGNFIMSTPGAAYVASGAALTNTVFDLNGFNQSVNGLSSDPNVTGSDLNLLWVTNSSATAATLTVGNNNANGSYAGILADGGSGTLALTKTGSGTETLSGVNTYTGNTTINGGTLTLSGSGSIAGSSNIIVAGGATFDVSAAGITLTGSSPVQTLAGGSTSGTATINAPAQTVTLNAGARLSFQATGGGSTTVGQISVADGTSALVLNNNVVTVNVTGSALAAGTYRLMSCAGTVSGPANTTPVITGTALVNATAAVSTTTGSAGHVDLVVTATGPGKFTNPTGITGFSLNGNNVVITATNGQAGDAYYLLMSTNLTRPLSQWTVVATNVPGNSGNYTFIGTNAITPGSHQQFYILSNTNN